MASENLLSNQRRLEDEFFLKEDAALLKRLGELQKMKESKEVLAQVSGIHNDAVLDKLVQLDIRPETVASLAIIPLVEVAWADDKMDEKEKKTVLAAIAKTEWGESCLNFELVEQWLQHRPEPHLLEAWIHYIKGLCEKLTAAEKKALKTELVDHTRAIAEAHGGFLGLGNKVSKAEAAMLDKLAAAFQ